MLYPPILYLSILLQFACLAACGGSGNSAIPATLGAPREEVTPPEPKPAPPIVRSVSPGATDPGIDMRSGDHLVALPADERDWNGQLLVYFPGTGAHPDWYRSLIVRAAENGYHALSLDYENSLSINYNICPGEPADCPERARLEILMGEEGPYIEPDVDVTNSAFSRLAALLRHLRDAHPNEGWEAFLTEAGEPDWARIATGGHSQGGGHAAMTAKLHKLTRVLLFGATEPARWTTQAFATPPERFRTLVHDREQARDAIVRSWNNIGIPGGTELVNTLPSPWGRQRLITVAEGCTGDQRSNGYYHNCYIVDGWMPAPAADGTPAFAAVWDAMLIDDIAQPQVQPGDVAVMTPVGESWIDPEVTRAGDEALMTWQDAAGGIWLADLSLGSGLPAAAPTRIGGDAAPLVRSYNGPEIGFDSAGPMIYYTQVVDGTAQAVRVGRDGQADILTTGDEHFSPLPTQQGERDSTRVLMLRRPPDWGTVLWLDTSEPASEHDLVTLAERTDGDARWAVGTATFATNAHPDAPGEITLIDTDTGEVRQVTSDGYFKTTPYAWLAPEAIDGNLLVLGIVDDIRLVAWEPDGNGGWRERFALASPSAEHPYLGSPEPFVAAGRSFISFTVRATLNQIPGVTDAQVWVTGIDPALEVTQRCDDGAPMATRVDPETLVGTDQVFLYYYTIDPSGSSVSRCATGIRP